MQNDKYCEVTFLPSNKVAHIESETTIADAAESIGIVLDLVCGARGTCGKCKVKATGALSNLDAAEKKRLTEKEILGNIRLACRAKIMGNVEVQTFSHTMFDSAKVFEAGMERDIHLQNDIKKVYITPKESSLENPVAITQTIMKSINARLTVPLTIAKRIASIFPNIKNGISVTYNEKTNKLIDVEVGDSSQKIYAIAMDIGTTTVVGALIDMQHGKTVASVGKMNQQYRYGQDVIARISNADTPEKLKNQQAAVIETVNEIVGALCHKEKIDKTHIYKIIFAANSTMTHLFFGVDVKTLGILPYVPAFNESIKTKAGVLGIHINHEASVQSLPLIGGFVGGDTVACIIASGIHKNTETSLLVDIGTNGEVVLAHKGRLYASSAPAGPAFEGAKIKHGMRGVHGAIEKVDINEDVNIHIIGDFPPRGICGSGIIDASAELVRLGIINKTGALQSADELGENISRKIKDRIKEIDGTLAFVLAEGEEGEEIYISREDIRELQLAKGAISSIITMLIKTAGITEKDIDKLYIAGAFGNYIRKESALNLGLIPKVDEHKIQFIGNAALSGAKMVLLSGDIENETEKMVAEIEHKEFGGDIDFQMIFAESMYFGRE